MKTAEAIYDEMADQFAQETGMELAGAGEMAVRLRALAAHNADLAEALSFRSDKLRRAVGATT